MELFRYSIGSLMHKPSLILRGNMHIVHCIGIHGIRYDPVV